MKNAKQFAASALAVTLFLSCFSYAGSALVISQVLYNPIGTESGGEAVEIYNNQNSAENIGGLKIATEASSRDAVIPENTTLCAGCYYLVADLGWNSSKDSQDWPDADHEELINLYNTNSGVAIMMNDDVIDAVGWGNPDEIGSMFFKGTPANETSEGNSLMRVAYTGDNSKDFIESQPSFGSSGSSASNASEIGIEFEVKEDTNPRISVSTSKIDFGKIEKGTAYERQVSIQNTGSVAAGIRFYCTGFSSNTTSVELSSGSYTGKCESSAKTAGISIQPGEFASAKITVKASGSAAAGKYSGRIMISPAKI